MSRYDLYLGELLLIVDRIFNTTKGMKFSEFQKDINLVDATGMRCQVIGETVKKLPKKLLKNYPEIKWDYLKEIRNMISHEYFRFDVKLLWDFSRNEVPELKEVISRMKEDLK
jgi:uncharacterized protein with HEPN domain